MTKLFRILIGVVAGLALVVFSVGNRQPVTLTFWPFPPEVEIRLFWVVLGAAFAGALIGGTAVWFGLLPKRVAARRERRRLAAVEREQLAAQRAAEERQAAERRARLGAPSGAGQTLLLPSAGR